MGAIGPIGLRPALIYYCRFIINRGAAIFVDFIKKKTGYSD